jgi:hypothetical protein
MISLKLSELPNLTALDSTFENPGGLATTPGTACAPLPHSSHRPTTVLLEVTVPAMRGFTVTNRSPKMN